MPIYAHSFTHIPAHLGLHPPSPNILPEPETPVHLQSDSQHHLRLVGHVGGRPARRLEGDELCPEPGRTRGDESRTISRRVLPPVHHLLRPPSASHSADRKSTRLNSSHRTISYA